MFNIFGSTKKILGIDKKNQENLSKDNENNKKPTFSGKIDEVIGFVDRKIKDSVEEYGVIRKKLKNLEKTNFDLAMKHLEKGNLPEATFRFKIVKKFWPQNHESYHKLAYCLLLAEKNDRAQIVVDELLRIDPGYKPQTDQLFSVVNKSAKTQENSQNERWQEVKNIEIEVKNDEKKPESEEYEV